MDVIKVFGARKAFGTKRDVHQVLHNFNMTVERGSIYSLMGSSGCGKTTLISSIVGLTELDAGDVHVFGEAPRKNCLSVGFMPQETALIDLFSIREMIWFYGTIYGLTSEKIAEKVKFLVNLLDLPDPNRSVKDCSGGQRRRVSFAVALIHEPELLVLDEPTVGIDPVLRAKVWDYLVELTRNQKVTVLLSTHYVEEAKQSTHVGIMRNGVLVIEDSPQNVLMKTGTEHLDDAFLMLSEKQENVQSSTNGKDYEMTELKSPLASSCLPQTKEKRILRNSNILKAMMIKNFLEIVRNPELFYVIVVFPIIAFLSIYYGVGGRIKGLTMGVINNEIESNANCANNSFLLVERKGFDCSFDKISCRFVNAIDDVDSRIEKVYYDSFDEAFNAVKSGRNIGFIQIASNFSRLLQLFNDDPDYAYQDDGMIQVFLDKTDLQKTSFVEQKLFEAYESFVESLMIDCGKSKNVGKLMIATSAAIGKFDFDFTGSFLPGFILTGCFAIAATITADGIVSEKSNGTWNRLLSVGVKPKHFLIAQLVVGSCLMIIQVIEFVASLFIYQQPAFTWNFLAINGAIFLLTGFVGLLFGLLCSIVSRTVFASYMLSQFSLYPVHFIAGTMWPIESMPTLLRYVSLFTPFAIPIKTLRRIFVGYLPFSDKRFILTCLILCGWCAFELFLSLWLIRDKKSKKVKI